MKTARILFRLVYRIISWAVILTAAIVVVLLLFGIHPYAVRTGSMEPAIPEGSICFVNQRAAFSDVREGDIIAFRSGGMLVTHRAVRIVSEGITTRGDANNTDDAAKITQDAFIGKTVFRIPYFGRLILFSKTAKGRILCIAGILLLAAGAYLDDRIAKKQKDSA